MRHPAIAFRHGWRYHGGVKLDPVSLQLFVAAMETGAIARAAQRAHIAPSAASRRLAELEARLHVRLFTRGNRGMAPTPAAHALLHLARGVLNDLDGIAAQMSDYGAGLRGQVRVAANISAITQFLPADLQRFLTRYPGVDVRLQEQISSAVARSVVENAADVGILSAEHHGGELAGQLTLLPYREDELVLVVPAGHPLARRRRVRLADALGHDLIGMHPGSAIHQLLQRGAAELGQPLRLRMQVTGYDALCLMVAAGLGVGVMPRGSAALYRRQLAIRVLDLAEPWARRRLLLCVRSLAALSTVAAQLVTHLQASADTGASEA